MKKEEQQENEVKRFLRPQVQVLDDSALIPGKNLITPLPNCFTHETIGSTPFYYNTDENSNVPDGEFPSGTKLVLFRKEEQEYCWAVDRQGLYVRVAFTNLKPLNN